MRSQVCIKETNESEPLLKCRESVPTVKTMVSTSPRKSIAVTCFTGYVAVVMQEA